MNDDDALFILNAPHPVRDRTHLHSLIALAISRGMHIEIVREKEPSMEEAAAGALLEFKLRTAKALAEPFFPRESAWERRNSNAPWYRRFQSNRRHK